MPHIEAVVEYLPFAKDVVDHIKKANENQRILNGLPRTILVLEGTVPGLDGEYYWRDHSERNRNAGDGWFEKAASSTLGRNSTSSHVVIQKQDPPSNYQKSRRQWTISVISNDANADDCDLFSAPDSGENSYNSQYYPPEVGWTANPTNAASRGLSPRVTIRSIPETTIHHVVGDSIESCQSSDDGLDTSSNRASPSDDDADMYDTSSEWT